MKLRLKAHELWVSVNGRTGPGAFVSRNLLLEAIAAYAESKR